MKKLSAMLLAIVLLFGLCACGDDSSGIEDETSFGITLAEYVESFNSVVDNRLTNDSGLPEEEYEAVKSKLKTSLDYFSVSEDDDRFYYASNGHLSYTVMLNENDNVQVISFSFPSDSGNEEMIIIHLCTWIIETVKPDMYEDYYGEMLQSVIDNGEAMDEGIALTWEDDGTTTTFSVYHAAI